MKFSLAFIQQHQVLAKWQEAFTGDEPVIMHIKIVRACITLYLCDSFLVFYLSTSA